MIEFRQLASGRLQNQPYAWAAIDNLFSRSDGTDLAKSFPRDHFKSVSGYGGEKDYAYEARALVPMGDSGIAYAEQLSASWLALAQDLVSPIYRQTISELSQCDLTTALLEVNVFHYGPRALLGPHPDLPDKVVTHVMYFNEEWERADGGCLTILSSASAGDVVAEVIPLVGNSAILVRSENSWHAVSPVIPSCNQSRRSLTATFYTPGSSSSLWPLDDSTPLHHYDENSSRSESRWRRLRKWGKNAVGGEQDNCNGGL